MFMYVCKISGNSFERDSTITYKIKTLWKTTKEYTVNFINPKL